MTPLDASDIARITSAVLQKLDGQKVDAGELNRAIAARTANSAQSARPSAPKVQAPAEKTCSTDMPDFQPRAKGARTRVIVASFGQNKPGIVAAISEVLAENSCSIEDMSQRIMQEFYTLIMIVDIGTCNCDFETLSEKLKATEKRLGITILAQHEDVFRFMHRV